MLDLFLTLEGVWDLQEDNSDVGTSHGTFYDDLYASHFAGGENCVLTITANNLDNACMSFTYASKRSCTTREFMVDKFNLFFPSGSSSSSGSSTSSSSCNSTIFGSVITLDTSSGCSCSLLVIGPLPGQRVIEKYSLEASAGNGKKSTESTEGMQLRVHYFISSTEGDFLVTRKYSRRPCTPCEDGAPSAHSKDWACSSDIPAMLHFSTSHSVNNWKRVKSHNFATLQALHIEVSVENNLQSLVAPDSAGHNPDSAYPSANAVIMYRIQVQLPAKDNLPLRSWHVLYRYSHFRSLWTYLCSELADIRASTTQQLPDLPPFPPKWPFVKSESSLRYRCKGLQHFICGVTSQGGYEPCVGSRAANMVDLLSAFLEVPNHFIETSPSPSPHPPHDAAGAGVGAGATTVVKNSMTSAPSTISSEDKCLQPLSQSVDRTAMAPVFVVVKGARNRRAPMFPHVSLFEWVPIVEYELFITRVEDNASKSVFRRYKDISSWFQNILDILSVSHSVDVLRRLELPAKKCTRHINTLSTSAKTDVTGSFVKSRIGDLQKSIQALLTEFPMVVNLPLSQEFFELHKFQSPGSANEEGINGDSNNQHDARGQKSSY